TSVQDLFPNAVGVDLSREHIEDCNSRLATPGGLSFLMTDELSVDRNDQYDVITCMEVLEHCVEEVATSVLEDLRRLSSREGVVIISVPVEIGPTILFKYLIRKIAGRRNLGDYKHYERYSAGELIRSMFAAKSTYLDRPIYTATIDDRFISWHSHKGFNWRR